MPVHLKSCHFVGFYLAVIHSRLKKIQVAEATEIVDAQTFLH